MKTTQLPSPLSTTLTAALLILTLLPAAGLLGRQDEEDRDQGEPRPSTGDVFFERLDVEVVNVEVYVTDKSGKSVRGLTAEDFELYEDGERQEITQFYAVENGRPTARAGGAAAEPAPPGAQPASAPTVAPAAGGGGTPPAEQALRLVVYFDNLFLRPTTRNKVTREVARFVHGAVGGGDLVMLVTFDRSLHVRQPFTRDLDSFLEQLDKIETVTGYGQRAATERRDVIQRIEGSRTAFEAESHADFYAKSLYNDASQSIKGLREVIGSLAGLAGRKALLYVSDGVPMTAGEELFHLLDLKFPDNSFSGRLLASQYGLRRSFRELTANANANGVTIYTLEATGLRSHASLSAEYGGLGDRSYVEIDSIREFGLEEPLMMMAADTGGLAALNTNNFDGALAKLTSDLDNYYSLGYAPVHAVEGRYHEIEVKTKRGGLEVRHRTGYRDKVSSTRVYEGTLATLLYGPEQNPLEVKLSFSGAKVQDDGQRLVPLEVRIPLGRVALIPREDVHQGQLRVAVAVIDADGQLSPVDQKEFPITVPAADLETARGQYYVYAVELLMRPGDHRVAVGVHDDYSGETSFLRQAIRTGT